MKHIKTLALVILGSATILSCSKDKSIIPQQKQSVWIPSESLDAPMEKPKKHGPIRLVTE